MSVAKNYLQPPDPVPPRTPGPMAFSEPDYVEDILGEAGFSNIAVDPVDTAMIGDVGADQQAEFLVTFGPVGRMIEEQKPSADVVSTMGCWKMICS